MLRGKKIIHMVGIGGIGMSGIAHLLLELGYKVRGSDVKSSEMIDMLKSKGATVYIGHDENNLGNADLVIYSSCITPSNPEIVKANRSSVPVVSRADILAELMNDKTGITVSGAHGKTTTTSLVSHLLVKADMNPTVAVGGKIINYNQNARLGNGRFFVAETDESDGSFLKLNPFYSIVTNIDKEHLDFYKDFKGVVNAFKQFISNTKKGGCLFFCADDKNLRQITKTYRQKIIGFGKGQGLGIYPLNPTMIKGRSTYTCIYKGRKLGEFSLQIPGMHNIVNSLAVIGLGMELGIDLKIIKESIKTYKGAARRFQIKYDQDDLIVIDDYAHHPTEIRATLAACKSWNPRRIVCIFQPHRFTRTKFLKEEFGKSFDDADEAIITDIYSASEKPIDGISSATIYEEVVRSKGKGAVLYLAKEDINNYLMKIIRKKDLVIFLGAGDITKLSDEFAYRLKDGQ